MVHIWGNNRPAHIHIVDRLSSLANHLAGAAPPGPHDFPALPTCEPSSSNRIPLPSQNACASPSRPQHSLPPIPKFTVPPGVRRAQRTPPPHTSVDFSAKKRPQAAPATPYYDPHCFDCPSKCRSPPPTPTTFQSATCNPFDKLIEQLKGSLSDIP